MEIWDYDCIEQEVLEASRSEDIAKRLAIAVFTILTPSESAVLFSIYDGKETERIAAENDKTVRAINQIKERLALKLGDLFSDLLVDG